MPLWFGQKIQKMLLAKIRINYVFSSCGLINFHSFCFIFADSIFVGFFNVLIFGFEKLGLSPEATILILFLMLIRSAKLTLVRILLPKLMVFRPAAV